MHEDQSDSQSHKADVLVSAFNPKIGEQAEGSRVQSCYILSPSQPRMHVTLSWKNKID